MPKPTIAILGGAFDPVHNGHMEVANQILRHRAADQVWMMPAYGHMYDKQMASPEHRMAMLRLATQNSPRIRAYDYEIKNKLGGSTHEFVQKLLSEPMSQNFHFKIAIGQDNADTFHKWKNADPLRQQVPFIVTSRAGSPVPDPGSWYLQKPHEYIPFRPAYQTSSTKVRSMVQENHPMVPRMVHPDVLGYIHDNKLYQS